MTRVLFVWLCAFGLAGCVVRPVELDSHLPTALAWEAALASSDGSTIRGSVIVQQLGDGTRSRVTIALAGSADGSLHSWHIHQGSCGEDSPVVGSASDYTPIPVGGSGQARLIAEMRLALAPGAQYFVHVFRAAGYAAGGPMRVAACGALTPVVH